MKSLPVGAADPDRPVIRFQSSLRISSSAPVQLVSDICSSVAEDPEVRTRKIVKVVTQTMINGKVVEESSEVEQIEDSKKWAKIKNSAGFYKPNNPTCFSENSGNED